MTVASQNTGTDRITVLRLAGEIGLGDMEALAGELTELVLANRNKVILNLRKVTHVSLGAIPKLAERNQRFRALGGEIKLVGPIPYVANLFKLVGAYTHFDIAPDEDEAVARFGS